jgi:hypothetical protein
MFDPNNPSSGRDDDNDLHKKMSRAPGAIMRQSVIFVTPDFLQKLFQQLVPEGVHDRKAATIKIVETFFKDNSENMTRRPK